MKNKIISWVIWAIIWWILVFWYSNLFTEGQNNNIWDKNMWPEWNGWVRMDIDSSNISDDQLEKMAERAGISIDELKEKIEAGDDIKPNRWWNRNKWESNTWKVLEEELENLE